MLVSKDKNLATLRTKPASVSQSSYLPGFSQSQARPFVKWVGGKRSILPELQARLPVDFKRYQEPFLGGGALFFALQPPQAVVSDINGLLICTYRAIRDDVESVMAKLKEHHKRHSFKYYISVREKMSTAREDADIAAWFIYLNKTCYNGLFRVNKAGKFNVPMGRYEAPAIVDAQNLKNCSVALQGVEILHQSFLDAQIAPKDFYYLDPPYHKTFGNYTAGGFGDQEHKFLADFCREIDRKGGFFMLSNSDTDYVRTLYSKFKIEVISASRFVSCKAHQRGKAKELIIRNYD